MARNAPTALRTARLSRGLSQQQLSDILGVSLACFWNFERGVRLPDGPMRAKIAMHLGFPVDDLWPPADDGAD